MAHAAIASLLLLKFYHRRSIDLINVTAAASIILCGMIGINICEDASVILSIMYGLDGITTAFLILIYSIYVRV